MSTPAFFEQADFIIEMDDKKRLPDVLETDAASLK